MRSSIVLDNLTTMNKLREAAAKIIEENNNIAIGLAVQSGDCKEIKRLHGRGARPMLPEGWSPIFTAAQNGHNLAIRCLSELQPVGPEKPWRVSAVDSRGFTALHAAAMGAHNDTCEMLVKDYGLDPNAATIYGMTPLLIAARNGSIGTIQTLVELGANADAEDKTGFTGLHFTAQQGMYECAKLFASEYGVNVNAITEHGNTPVHLAAQTGEHEILRALIEDYGAEINPKNNRNKTPMDLAADNARDETVVFLQQLQDFRKEVGSPRSPGKINTTNDVALVDEVA